MEASKTKYEAPTLEVVGSFESLTRAAVTGGHLDKSFPVGTPDPALTFS